MFAQTCHGKFTCCLRVAVVLNFSPCFVSRRPGHSGRKMRNRRLAPVIVGEICPRCPDKVLGLADTLTKFCCAKKHFDEQSRFNQFNCCFPLVECGAPCNGTLVKCPLRLFPVFDSFRGSRTGTLICEGHLTLADKDHRIIVREEYTPPKKVRQLQRFIFKLSCLL